jgi:hypothetical protein
MGTMFPTNDGLLDTRSEPRGWRARFRRLADLLGGAVILAIWIFLWAYFLTGVVSPASHLVEPGVRAVSAVGGVTRDVSAAPPGGPPDPLAVGRRLLGSGAITASWLLHPVAWRWNAEVIKVFAWLSLAGSTLCFVLGLFVPTARPFHP